jgi:nucleoside-diphosphate-sugar epimerase
MKALLIGGTGTISLPIAQRLLALGWDLTVLNRGTNNHLLPGARHIQADMADAQDVQNKLQGLRFDVVAQFIAYLPRDVERDIRLFQGKCSQYIFISTASAYHKPPRNGLIDESTPLHNPYWAYSRAKAECEAVLMRAYRQQGFPVTIVRPSHTYGLGHLPMAVRGKKGIWQIVQRMLQEKPVLVPGDGTNLWTVTWSEDFAPAFIGLMGNIHALGEAVHITSDEALTWNQIYSTVAAALDRPFLPCHVPSTLLARVQGADWEGGLLGDKANCAVFDTTKIKRLVPGFCCPTRFDQGARLSLAWLMEHPDKQRPDPDFDAVCDRAVEIMAQAARGFAGMGL